MKQPPKACAYSALRKSVRIFRDRMNVRKPSPFFPKGRKMLAAMRPPEDSLADDEARLFAGKLMIDELLRHHKRVKNRGYRHFLATFCWDAGILAAGGHSVEDREAMQIRVYKALKKLGLSAVCVFEISALHKSKNNRASILVHIHAIAWTKDRSFKPVAAGKKLSSAAGFQNSLGAPSVTFRTRKMAASQFADKGSLRYKQLFSKLDRDQTKTSIAWLGYYVWQAPAWGKHLVPRKGDSNHLRMYSNSKNYSFKLAAALEDCLSRFDICDAVFSVGEGKKVAGPWRQRFKKGNLKRRQTN